MSSIENINKPKNKAKDKIIKSPYLYFSDISSDFYKNTSLEEKTFNPKHYTKNKMVPKD